MRPLDNRGSFLFALTGELVEEDDVFRDARLAGYPIFTTLYRAVSSPLTFWDRGLAGQCRAESNMHLANGRTRVLDCLSTQVELPFPTESTWRDVE